jgi:xylan 1,4-beta-xylosidase
MKAIRPIVSLALAVVAGFGLTGSRPAQGTALAAETIRINARGPARPFPHFWERMFGSGRAILTLRESYRSDLQGVKQVTGFQFVRFHAIFHDEVGLYSEDSKGTPAYNFSYIDQIYDGLLDSGVRPFVELSFMPSKLAAANILHPFWYKPNTSPPKDWERWGELVYNLGRHLVDRYGADEVARWYFEVWNEPNIDFWAGAPKEETYYKLYDAAARALKRVSPRLRVGGPSTAQAAWVDRFIGHCFDSKVPVDFVSTHVYANDSARDVFGTDEHISRQDMVYRAVKKVYDQVKASPMPNLPIEWSEFNASYMNEIGVTDSPFIGPWLANTIRQCDGLVDMMSYWTFSDVFEEQGVVKRPFYGGFGLIAAGHIPKASYNVFKLLHRLGDKRISVDSESAIATTRADGSLAIVVWNYAGPEDAGLPRTLDLSIEGLAGKHQALVQVVDRQHGSALTAWEAMGQPAFPAREQIDQLRKSAQLPAPERRAPLGTPAIISITLEPHALALIEIVGSKDDTGPGQ